jgi:NADP-dependent 3-hydroxy acid dehydrogenase YdfG
MERNCQYRTVFFALCDMDCHNLVIDRHSSTKHSLSYILHVLASIDSSSIIMMTFGSVMIIDIVTGATMGIGRAVAESILFTALHQKHEEDSSYALFLVGRNVERGKQVADSFNKQILSSSSPQQVVFFETCDVSDYQQVLDLKGRIAQQFKNKDFCVNCLVNCAAECPKQQVLVQRKNKKWKH